MEKNNFLWPVVLICTAQRRDVNPFDLLTDGKYRKCSVINVLIPDCKFD